MLARVPSPGTFSALCRTISVGPQRRPSVLLPLAFRAFVVTISPKFRNGPTSSKSNPPSLLSEIPTDPRRAPCRVGTWGPSDAHPSRSFPPSLHCLLLPPNRLRPVRLLKAIQPQPRHPHPSQLHGTSSKESWPAHSAHPANPALPVNSSGT